MRNLQNFRWVSIAMVNTKIEITRRKTKKKRQAKKRKKAELDTCWM